MRAKFSEATRKRFVQALVISASLPIIGPLVVRGIQRALQVSARFDAMYQGWGERSWLFQSLQDAWVEYSSMDRQEAQRIHESLVENSAIVQKIRNLKIQFSVGQDGLKIIPESSDEGFNSSRGKSFEDWWKRPELSCNISGGQLTRVWSGLLFDKGEIFVNLTQDEVLQGTRKVKVPRLQTIDAHRVKTPSGKTKEDGTGYPIIDGITVNPKTGKRVAYWVRKTDYATSAYYGQQTTTEDFDRIPAFDPENPMAGGIIHIFKMRRPGLIRGQPEGISVYNLVRDNMDLHKLEMQAAKLACEIANVEMNPSGELDALLNRKSKLQINTQNIAGASTTKNAWADYRVSIGGRNLAMKTGTSIEQFMIKRPTVAQQDYWDLQITFICVGYNVPKLLVMPYSLQGTVTRADLDICTAAFREEFELIRELCETVYQWQGEWETKYNTRFKPQNYRSSIPQAIADKSRWIMDSAGSNQALPDDLHACLIRPPRPPNVDIGYTAKALEIEMRLGIKTFQRVFADMNLDWRTEFRQLAEAQVFLTDLCNEPQFKGKVAPGQLTSLAVEQAIEDPTNKPDAPEGGKEGSESSPENREAAHVI